MISAEADTATVFLTCSIHDFPANVPIFLRKRRNLKLILTKAEGVIYVPQINSVNVQLWAAAQMQSLGFKMSADNVHFFSAEHDKSGGHHQFSMYDLQHEKNAFIVGYPNTGKTSLFNVLTEAKFSKDANELRYALPKNRRELKSGRTPRGTLNRLLCRALERWEWAGSQICLLSSEPTLPGVWLIPPTILTSPTK